MPSIIEDHPQRQMIIDALMAGEATRKVAARTAPPVSPAAVQRYRVKVLSPALRRVQAELIRSRALETAANADSIPLNSKHIKALQADARSEASVSLVADPLISRLSLKQERRARWLQGAESKEDYRACAAIDRGETSDIELEAKLTGRLDAPIQTQNNTIIVVMPAPAATAPGVQEPDSLTIDVTSEK